MARKPTRKWMGLWIAGLVLAGCYLLTGWTLRVPLAASAAVAGTILYAGRSNSAMGGAARGLLIGSAGAVGVCFAIMSAVQPPAPQPGLMLLALDGLVAMDPAGALSLQTGHAIMLGLLSMSSLADLHRLLGAASSLTVGLCVLSGLLFGFLARRRKAMMNTL